MARRSYRRNYRSRGGSRGKMMGRRSAVEQPVSPQKISQQAKTYSEYQKARKDFRQAGGDFLADNTNDFVADGASDPTLVVEEGKKKLQQAKGIEEKIEATAEAALSGILSIFDQKAGGL